jgi:hypothetical protein
LQVSNVSSSPGLRSSTRRCNTASHMVDKESSNNEKGIHPMNADQSSSPRNGLGAVTFVVAVLGALLAVIPAAAAFGALLCFVAIIPAIVSFRRVRRGNATNDRRAVAALVLAPVFFIVALSVGVATSPPLPTSSNAGTPPLTNRASTPALQQSPAAIASSPGPAAAPAQAPLATAPAPAAVAKAPVAVAPAPARAPVAAPLPARSPAPAAAPPPPPAGSAGGASCDEGTHYINSSGACVPRPTAAAAPPPGATAKCVDGEYSFSQHHQGTCSGHGGVAQYL